MRQAFGDVTQPRRTAMWPRWRCTAPANYFDADLLTGVVEASDGPTGRIESRRFVLEGRHFCAGLDFGSSDTLDGALLRSLYSSRGVTGQPSADRRRRPRLGHWWGLGLASSATSASALPTAVSPPTSPGLDSIRVSASLSLSKGGRRPAGPRTAHHGTAHRWTEALRIGCATA